MASESRRLLPRRRGGFTLIELIVALTILVVVLGMAYQILENCLETEKWVQQASTPEKAGQGIIALIRKDIEGAVYHNLGTDLVFLVNDGGMGETARDELHLFTTREPTPLEDQQSSFNQVANLRTITAVSYFLRESSGGLYMLIRRENTPGAGGDPFQTGTGMNFEVYDKVVSFSVQCFDAGGVYDPAMEPWRESWDSRERALLEAADQEALAAEGQGIPRVTGQGNQSTQVGDPEDPALAAEEEASLPPAAIPSAVRIEITILTGDERGLYKKQDGTPMPPQVFSTIVPLLVAQRIPLTQEETGDTAADSTLQDGSTQIEGKAGKNQPGGKPAGQTPKR